MPLVRISLRKGKPPAYRAALAAGVYGAMRAEFDVPDGDNFVLMHEHDDDDFIFDAAYLGMRRSLDLIVIQITCNDTRSKAQKVALYRSIVDRCVADTAIDADDILINLVEVKKENWSFGRGIAQYV